MSKAQGELLWSLDVCRPSSVMRHLSSKRTLKNASKDISSYITGWILPYLAGMIRIWHSLIIVKMVPVC